MVKVLCWEIVYKFLLEEQVIVVRDIEWIVGWIGNVIFIVVMDLVQLVGMIVFWVFLYNFDYFVEKDICLGDIVLLYKVGDIILEIFWVIIEKCLVDSKFYEVLIICLECGVDLVYFDDEVVLCCVNLMCLV